MGNPWKERRSDSRFPGQLLGQTKAIRIEERQAISDNEVILSLFIERENGRSLRAKMKVQRIGNEWKMAGIEL